MVSPTSPFGFNSFATNRVLWNRSNYYFKLVSKDSDITYICSLKTLVELSSSGKSHANERDDI